MKHKYFLLSLFTVLPLVFKGQDTLRFYFDKDWKPTSDYLSYYYRDMYKSDTLWTIIDYFPDGQIQMKGASLTLNTNDKHGLFTFYFENGNKQGEGRYSHGKRVGDWKWWHESGSVQSLGNYGKDGKFNGEWKSFYENGQLAGERNYKSGKKVGQWKWYFDNGKKSAVEQYMNDSLLSARYWNRDGSILKNPENAIRDAEFPGGLEGMKLFIEENLVFPEDIKKLGISGIVYVSFIVGTNGTVTEIKILRSPHSKLSESVIAMIKKMPRWKPAKNHNVISEYKAVLPVKFTLTE